MGVAVNVLLCILPDREGEKCPSCPASRSSPLMCWRCLMLVGSWSVPSELDQSQVGCPLAQTHLGLLALVGYSNPPKNPILSWLGWPTHQDHGSVPSKLSGQCHWLLFLISPRTTPVTRPPATGSRTDRANSEPLPLPQLPKVQFYSAGTGSQTKYGPSPLVSGFSLALCDGSFMCTLPQHPPNTYKPLPIPSSDHPFLTQGCWEILVQELGVSPVRGIRSEKRPSFLTCVLVPTNRFGFGLLKPSFHFPDSVTRSPS